MQTILDKERNQEIKQNWSGTENSNNNPISFVKK